MKLCVSAAAALLAFASVSHVEGLALFKKGKKNIGMPGLPEKGKPKAIGEILRKWNFLLLSYSYAYTD
jgi:hypothetical protein